MSSLELSLESFFSKLEKNIKLSVYSGDFDFYMFRVFFPHVYSVRGYISNSIAFINGRDFDLNLLTKHYIVIIRNLNKNITDKSIIKTEKIQEFTILYADKKFIKIEQEKFVNNIVSCNYVCFIFPRKVGVDTTKIKISNVGLYSVTSSKFNQKIIDIILQHNKNNKNITIMDCTAWVGGDTVGFGLVFDKVVSLEKDPVNYECLVNNINVYELENVIALNFDFLERGFEIIDQNKPSILYFDPPWGGKDYYLQDKIELFLNDKNIKDIFNDIFNKFNFVDAIVVKAPSNYNIDETSDIKIYDLKKFKVIVFIRKI